MAFICFFLIQPPHPVELFHYLAPQTDWYNLTMYSGGYVKISSVMSFFPSFSHPLLTLFERIPYWVAFLSVLLFTWHLFQYLPYFFPLKGKKNEKDPINKDFLGKSGQL